MLTEAGGKVNFTEDKMTRELRYYRTTEWEEKSLNSREHYYSYIYSEEGKVVTQHYYVNEFDFPEILKDLVIRNRGKGSLRVIEDRSIVEPLKQDFEKFQKRQKELSS